jgi:hypothetical protein
VIPVVEGLHDAGADVVHDPVGGSSLLRPPVENAAAAVEALEDGDSAVVATAGIEIDRSNCAVQEGLWW